MEPMYICSKCQFPYTVTVSECDCSVGEKPVWVDAFLLRYNPSLLWKAFKAASTLADEAEVPPAIGIAPDVYDALKHECGAFREALEAGLAERSEKYPMLSLLPPDLKQYWHDLVHPDLVDQHQRALMLIAEGGEAMKKRMFAIALIESNFQVGKVFKVLGISKKTYDKWVKEDPEFLELVQEVQFQKKAFAEQQLFSLVNAGSEKSVIFVNERLNKEQYGNELKVSGEIAHTHGTLDLAALDLPLELQTAILNHLQTKGMVDSDGLLIGQ